MPAHHLYTEIEIHAGAARVWQVLTEFGDYPEWNPFLRRIGGVPRVGARLEVLIQPGGGGRARTFRPVVKVAEPGRELVWKGRLLIPGLFDGEHRFFIQPLGDEQVVFQHSERFSGLLVPLFRSSLDRDTRRGFEDMNLALKKRCQAHHPAIVAPIP